MSRQTKSSDVLDWLLEKEEPGVRYLALRDVLHRSDDDRELRAARRAAHQKGPIAAVLEQMDASGYWVKPGPGYNPKYRSTVWALTLLAQLGAELTQDKRIAQACEYVMEHALTPTGQFTYNGSPAGTIDCLQGNLAWALLEMGFDDPRLDKAFEWMARSVTGEGVAPVSHRKAEVRYYGYKCGPNFACSANNRLPCAWGGIKVLRALAQLPQAQRTPLVQRAIQQGIDFLFSVDPVTAAYPFGSGSKPNSSWFKFGFPVFYITDVLQIAETLRTLGYGKDERLANTLEFIRAKQDAGGRWALEYDYAGKTWLDFGVKKQPNKWVTLRALRALEG